MAASASLLAVPRSPVSSAESVARAFFLWMRTTARSSWFVSTAAFSSSSVWASSFAAFFRRSSMSSRRRMMAAVADLSFAYFSTIELIAFSYAISGCSFSTFEIQIERKPRQRFARRLKNPISAM